MAALPDLIDRLANAQRNGTRSVDPLLYSGLDRETAYAVMSGVQTALAAPTGMLKTGIHGDGVGVVAPIYGSNVGTAAGYRMASPHLIGLELEVGFVLAKDIDASASIDVIEDAIDHYFFGAEICGTRYTDRSIAGPNGGLADNMSALGYVIGPKRTLRSTIDGLDLSLEFSGRQIHAAPARHGFGTVLASVVAYAKAQRPDYPLKAGTMVTTGSLCGLVPVSGAGHVVGRLGDDIIEFDLA